MARARRLHEAASCYVRALADQQPTATVWHEHGSVLAALDDARGALKSFDRALALDPSLVAAHNDRGVALRSLSRLEEARAAFEQALRLQPSSAQARANLGSLALGRGELRDAEESYRAALRDDLALAPARLGLGRALAAQGRWAEARIELEQLLARCPTYFDALLAVVALELDAARVSEAIVQCERFLALSPWHSGALGVRSELERELDPRRASEKYLRLLALERWLHVRDLELDEDWLSELARLLPSDESLVHEPPHHATRGGRHSGALSRLRHPSLALLEGAIERQLAEYCGAVRDRDWAAARPTRVALHSWAVVLPGEGFQQPHLHPDAWLSGVFYVAVPPQPGYAGNGHRGSLELGRVDPELALRKPRERRLVEALPGRLVIFPSWLYHSTVPHQSAGLRMSVAFDCVRAP